MSNRIPLIVLALCTQAVVTHMSRAQSVCLPAPRLLTTMPMGGRAGSEVEITITGESIDGATELIFSHPGLAATQKKDDKGDVVANQFLVSIADDCPEGIHEARLMTPLGLSSSRVFSVNSFNEVTQTSPSVSLDTAMTLPVNSVCNAVMPVKAINHYRFTLRQGQRVTVDCAARGIESKLNAVLIVADSAGRDLMVERGGDLVDFTAPSDGDYIVKVHDLTFNGGPHYFYRLALRELASDAAPTRMASVREVHEFSWPPVGLPGEAALVELEPNNKQPQQIALPCDIAGSFFPAADVDTFEFNATKGEVWWVEVASARLGCPTDPSIIVQRVEESPAGERLVDVIDFSDIPQPVKVSSNGYAYDGPPFLAGTSDILSKLEIPVDGRYQLKVLDLFGGTRSDPKNVYRLVIRKAAPDFALVGWGLHMELRNGDRNALSKPIALRPGGTMAIEVVVIRRDGFDGEIELAMENLPDGVTAQGLTIPAGKSRGIVLVTAHENAPFGRSDASFVGRGTINGEAVTRPCRLASMQWPVKDSKQEIPSQRLLASVPVSVGKAESAAITIQPRESKVYEAPAGTKLTIPLVHLKRSEFSGASISMRTWGNGFESNPMFDLPLGTDASEVTLDLAKLKTPPGEYCIAFYGGGVVKYVAGDEGKSTDIADVIVSEPINIRVLAEAAK